MAIYLEQFLYQGRPPGSAQPASWHVVLGEAQTTFGVERVVLSDPMTPEAAAALGRPLPDILADINTAAMAQVVALQAEVAALQLQVAALQADEAKLE